MTENRSKDNSIHLQQQQPKASSSNNSSTSVIPVITKNSEEAEEAEDNVDEHKPLSSTAHKASTATTTPSSSEANKLQAVTASFLLIPGSLNNINVVVAEDIPSVRSYAKHSCVVYFVVVVLCCVINFGNYMGFDSPAAIQEDFEADLHMTTSQFTLFYSVYSVPNVVLCFFCGYLIDHVLGIRLSLVIFASVMLFGQILFFIGPFVESILVSYVARFFVGIGSETLDASVTVFMAYWFHGRKLNFVYGILVSVGRVSLTMALIVTPLIYKSFSEDIKGHDRLAWTLVVVAIISSFSVISSLVLATLDKLKREIPATGQSTTAPAKLKFRDIVNFPVQFWLVVFIITTFNCTLFPFISLGKLYFIKKYAMSKAAASHLNSVVYLIAIVLAPLTGYLVDQVGYNVVWVMAGCFGAFLAYSVMCFTFVWPLAPMFLLGVSNSLYVATAWPMIAIIVEKEKVGTAYGILYSLLNLGQTITNMLTGIVVQKFGYFILQIIFIIYISVSLMSAVLLFIIDKSKNGSLSKSRRIKVQK